MRNEIAAQPTILNHMLKAFQEKHALEEAKAAGAAAGGASGGYASMSARRADQYAREAEAHALHARRVAMQALAAAPRRTQYDPYTVLEARSVAASPFGVRVD